MSDLVYRHNRITRVTHWANTLAIAVLFMSGLMIFNAFPELHWGSKAEPREAFFAIRAVNEEGDIRAYTEIYGHKIDTTGLLGLENTEMGPMPRAFPSWITVPGFYCLSCGRRWHFFFAWLFALNGLLYLVYNAAKGHIGKFFLTPRDLGRIVPMALYYLRLRKTSPQDGEYNPLQKLAYTSVFFILTPLIILSGLSLSPQMDAGFHWLPALFGGRQSARSFHFLTTFFFAFFTFGHVFMVASTGVLNNMRSMLTGWYREKHGSEFQVSSFEPPESPPLAVPAEEAIEKKKDAEEVRVTSGVEPKAVSADDEKEERGDDEKNKS